jgi:hypothetical protein
MQGFIPLKAGDRAIVESMIRNVKTTKRSICECMIWAMEYA